MRTRYAQTAHLKPLFFHFEHFLSESYVGRFRRTHLSSSLNQVYEICLPHFVDCAGGEITKLHVAYISKSILKKSSREVTHSSPPFSTQLGKFSLPVAHGKRTKDIEALHVSMSFVLNSEMLRHFHMKDVWKRGSCSFALSLPERSMMCWAVR